LFEFIATYSNCSLFRGVMAKIIVIDDDRSISESLELYLSEEGHEVMTANTGTDGLNMVLQTSPDIVILDIRLPDIDGLPSSKT